MDLQQLFSMLPQDAGLAGEFSSAIAAGKEVLEKFLKDHDINAAVEEVVKYVQEHAADLAGIIPGDLLGNIGNLNGASQFANTMAMMLNAGLPMTKSVTITSRVMTNYFFSTQIGKITARLEEGQTLGKSLRDAACMPDIMVDMAAVGEESGELAQTLTMTAEYYDAELEQATADALAKLEPTILVFLAGFAGFIVIAIYMAMFGMYAAM